MLRPLGFLAAGGVIVLQPSVADPLGDARVNLQACRIAQRRDINRRVYQISEIQAGQNWAWPDDGEEYRAPPRGKSRSLVNAKESREVVDPIPFDLAVATRWGVKKTAPPAAAGIFHTRAPFHRLVTRTHLATHGNDCARFMLG